MNYMDCCVVDVMCGVNCCDDEDVIDGDDVWWVVMVNVWCVMMWCVIVMRCVVLKWWCMMWNELMKWCDDVIDVWVKVMCGWRWWWWWWLRWRRLRCWWLWVWWCEMWCVSDVMSERNVSDGDGWCECEIKMFKLNGTRAGRRGRGRMRDWWDDGDGNRCMRCCELMVIWMRLDMWYIWVCWGCRGRLVMRRCASSDTGFSAWCIRRGVVRMMRRWWLRRCCKIRGLKIVSCKLWRWLIIWMWWSWYIVFIIRRRRTRCIWIWF